MYSKKTDVFISFFFSAFLNTLNAACSHFRSFHFFFFFWPAALVSTQFWNFAPFQTATSPLVYRRAALTINIFAFADVCVCARWRQAYQLGVQEKMAVER